MNNGFKFLEDLTDFYNSNYKTDPNYDKSLDLKYNLRISERDKGTKKAIKVKREVLVCEKNCKKCKRVIDKVFNHLNNNCGRLKEKKEELKIYIPREIREGQKLILIGKGKNNNNKYGNLNLKINIG